MVRYWLLTSVERGFYSAAMISDFELLTQKVEQLAMLAHSLRHENAELRRNATDQAAQMQSMRKNMNEAHQRLDRLLEKLPPEITVDEDVA